MKLSILPLGVAILLAATAHGDGIPEPGMVFYGVVFNSAQGNSGRLAIGSLNWTVTSPGTSPITVTAALADLNGQYSYRLRIPYETIVGGNTTLAGTFILHVGSTVYSHAGIQFNAGGSHFPASIVGPALAVYNFSAANRGVVQRLDLRVNAPGVLPIGGAGSTGGTSGTLGNGDPLTFQFTSISARAEGGVVVQWTGAPTHRSYELLRAEVLEAGLGEYQVVKTFPVSPANSDLYWDTNAVNTATYFYQLRAQ